MVKCSLSDWLCHDELPKEEGRVKKTSDMLLISSCLWQETNSPFLLCATALCNAWAELRGFGEGTRGRELMAALCSALLSLSPV